MTKRRKHQDRDCTMAERVVIMTCRLNSNGRIYAHAWADEFKISIRQVYRDIAVVDRYLPLRKEKLDNMKVSYSREEEGVNE